MEIILLDGEASISAYATYNYLLSRSTNFCGAEKVVLSHDDVVLLPYSSGTTGLPKGVMVTNGNLLSHVSHMASDELGYYDPPVSGINFIVFYTTQCAFKR